MQNIPNHIAIIPDGNRRWAKGKHLPPSRGHFEGAKTLEKIIRKAYNLKINYLTIWGGSIANTTERSEKEIATLMDIYTKYFNKIASAKETHENQVRIRVLGRWAETSTTDAKNAVARAIDLTKDYSRCNLTFLLSYNGTDEMIEAVKSIVQMSKTRQDLETTPQLLKEHLWTKSLPPVDLLIRTGGEPHWSKGFMMWDVAEARLCFTETLWPDFSEKEMERIVKGFATVERRYGK